MEKYEFTQQEKQIMENTPVPYAVYQLLDNRVVTVLVSDGFCDLFGMTREEAMIVMDSDMYRDAHSDDKARIANAAYRFATEEESFDVVYRSRNRGSEEYTIIHSFGKHIYKDDGTRLAVIWYVNEGEYSEYEEKHFPEEQSSDFNSHLRDVMNEWIRRVSRISDNYYDSLTGIPNISYFMMLAENYKYSTLKEGGTPLILFFDLNGMKAFNEKYGFNEGDKLLIAFAEVLKKHFTNENCGRYGADHFVVYTADNGDIESTLDIIFEEIKMINGGVTLPVRVGICESNFKEISAKMACDRAKIACDHEKESYASHYAYFNQELQDNWESRSYVRDNLEKAINSGWINVYYQPIVRSITGLVCSEEALCRWVDPEKGLLPPDEFIPVLEDAGLLYKLDLHMVDLIIEDFKTKKKEGLRLVPVSVNLSWNDFQVCDMVEEIAKRMDHAGLPHDLINIEVTERVIGNNPEYMKHQIKRFHDSGFQVWMDDFGSGYSSLDIMQNFEFDLIKFNMQFMKDFDSSYKSKIIITELTQMAIKLGIDTLSEGVEYSQQVSFLREIGCDKIQGYFYSKPQPLENVITQYHNGTGIGVENIDEADYYDVVSKSSLKDPMASSDYDKFINEYFSAVPVGIIEVRDGKYYVLRHNRPYGDFLKNKYKCDVDEIKRVNCHNQVFPDKEFCEVINKCIISGEWESKDGEYENSEKVKAFIRKLAVNEVTGATAVIVIIISMMH